MPNNCLTYRPTWPQVCGIICSAVLFFLIPLSVPAEQISQEDPKTVVELPKVKVRSSRITPTTGISIIDREIIRNLPLGNGSINEIIGIAPGVQFSEDSLDAMTGGEITPPVVSISGSRFYDNNYTIDGISNNSPLDPASDAFSDANKLPGHPQTHFLNPRLIEEITVYNSNIPAEYGGFTGGQVDARTLSVDPEFRGQINYRTTSDQWTQFHIHPDNSEDFAASNSSLMQPDFTKHDVGMLFNLPLSQDTGLLASYQQTSSRIQLQHLGSAKSETRHQENFFFKLEHYLYDNSRLQITALHSPTSSERFLRDFRNSDYQLDSDSTSLILQWEKNLSLGLLNAKLGYTEQQRRRRSVASSKFMWNPDTPTIDWPSGFDGGLGALSTDQQEFSLNIDFTLTPFQLGTTDHQVKLGTAVSRSRQDYRRPENSYFYYAAEVDSAVTCTVDDPACIPGEQYLTRRTLYNEARSRAQVKDYAVYLQDSIAWKRLEMFPGVRVSHDDFTDRTNVAPRLSLSLDIFGNQRTVLFAGKNRYYSGTLLTHALFESIVTENQWRESPADTPEAWNSSVIYLYGDSDVKTPYTDEISVGLIQRVLGGEFKLQYIEKSSRDEFARQRIDNPLPESNSLYILNNNGRSEHESIQVSWERSWGNHFFSINSTWQETSTSHTDYDSTFSPEDSRETIWYQGDELFPYEIPRRDFNRPVIANLVYTWQLPHQLTMTGRVKYRGAYWRLWLSRDADNRPIRRESEVNPGENVFVYERRKSHSSVTCDMRMAWRFPSFQRHNLVFSMDILNLFDRQSKIAYQQGPVFDYEQGRQIWAGLEFNF